MLCHALTDALLGAAGAGQALRKPFGVEPLLENVKAALRFAGA